MPANTQFVPSLVIFDTIKVFGVFEKERALYLIFFISCHHGPEPAGQAIFIYTLRGVVGTRIQ